MGLSGTIIYSIQTALVMRSQSQVQSQKAQEVIRALHTLDCQCRNALPHTPVSLLVCLVFFTHLYDEVYFFLIRYYERNHSYLLNISKSGTFQLGQFH